MTKLYVARSSQWVKAGATAVPFASASSRDQLVLGTYKPGATTTGVLPGTRLTVVTSASQLPGGALTPGTTYGGTDANGPYGYDIRFTVVPPTSTTRIVFRNCIFRGEAAAPTAPIGLLKVYNAGHAPVDLWDCTLLPQTPSPWRNGLHGDNFRAYRCDISMVVDALAVFARPSGGDAKVELYQSYIHDFVWFDSTYPGTSVPDGSHNDGVQPAGGSNFKIWGNHIYGHNHPDYLNTYYGTDHCNAIMMITPDDAQISGLDIQQNWLYGGAAGLNIVNSSTRTLGNVGIIKANRFGRDMRNGANWAINQSSGVTYDAGSGATANVYDDNNAVVVPKAA